MIFFYNVFNGFRWATCLIRVCLLSLILATSAFADEGDVFNTILGTNYFHDSNLFRLAPGVQPLGEGAQRSDNIWRTNAGFSLRKKYSLQEFQVDYMHVETKYDNAKYLNFNANNYKATWLWALTPRFKGSLSTDRKVDLVPFFDFTNTSVRNVRTAESQNLDMDFSPHDKWHLLGGFTKLDVQNSQPFLPQTSFKYDAVEGGIKYQFPSFSYFSLKIRNRQGENQETNFASFVGKGFKEDEQELNMFWNLTGKSSISSNFGHVRHIDDTFAVRDFSGLFGGINYKWDPTSKLNLTFDIYRKLASYTDLTSSYTVYDAFSFKPTWSVTPKIFIRGNFLVAKRRFEGDGPVNLTSNDRLDNSIGYGIGIDWVPRSTIRLGINLQHDERDSNYAIRNLDFTSNSASFNGQLTF